MTSQDERHPEHRSVGIGDVVDVLRRRWRVLAACLLAGVVAAGIAAAALPTTYVSRAVVTVNPVSTNPLQASTQAEVSTVTEASVVSSTSVAARAAAILDAGGEPADLLDRVDVSSPLGSSVLDISFSAATPQLAADGANAFAQAYLAYRRDTAEGAIASMVDTLQQQIDDLQAQADQVGDTIAAPQTSESQAAQLQVARTQLLGQADDLLSQQVQLRTIQVVPGELIDPGLPATDGGARSVAVFLAAGTLLGLLAGVGTALWRDRRDDVVRDEGDVSRAGTPVLASLPGPASAHRAGPGRRPGADDLDAYGRVSAKVLSAAGNGQLRSVVLLRAGHDGDPSPVPAHLAATFAGQGVRVVLAACSLGISRACEVLGVPAPDRTGPVRVSRLHRRLTAGGAELLLLDLGDEATLQGRWNRLPGPADHAELGHVDIVVLDGIDVAHPGTGLTLAGFADAGVLVVDRGRTSTTVLHDGVDDLNQVGTPVFGSILVTPAGRHRRSRGRPADGHSTEGAGSDRWREDSPPGPPRASHPTSTSSVSAGGQPRVRLNGTGRVRR